MVAKAICRKCMGSGAARPVQMASSSSPSSERARKTPQSSSSSSSASTSEEDVQRWVRSPRQAHQALARSRPSVAQLPAGVTGLENLGNTCYMNSVLQVLSYTEGFAHYMLSGFYREDLNSQSATRGDIADEVARLLVVLWSRGFRYVSPHVLRGAIGSHRTDFGGSRMHDAHEFLLLLLEWLHDDLNVATPAPKPTPVPDGLDDVEAADRGWRQFRKSNDSIISRVFYGQQKSVLLCTACGHESATFETFTLLSLPLAPGPGTGSQLSLYHCLQQYVHGDLISGWTCANCRRTHDVFKKLDIWRMPPVAIMHLKRFTYSGSTLRKAHAYVSFPLRDLDLSQLAIGPPQPSGSLVYDLYGVVEHHGSSQSGHYTAFCWNQPAARWFFYDDTSVKEVSAARVKEASAYMLCYAAREVA